MSKSEPVLPNDIHRTEILILGVSFAIDVPATLSRELFVALQERAVLTASGPGASLTYELRQQGDAYEVHRQTSESSGLIGPADSIEQAADLIADDVHPWVAENHPSLLFVHAGAVEMNGIGIIVPGRTFSGKSSLVAALLRAGATYMSDEFAPIDRDGNVHPYPRHLSIRNSDGTTTLTPPGTFAAPTAAEPVRVGLVVDTIYRSDATFVPERIRGVGPLLAVVDNTLVARSRPAHTMEIVAGLASHADVLRSPRGDADEAAAVILACAAERIGG